MDCVIPTPLGPMLLEEREGAVTALRFLRRRGGPVAGVPPERTSPTPDQGWLQRYFAGDNPGRRSRRSAPAGTAFQLRVWQAVSAVVLYGETVSYGELARQIGCRSARAVGAALGKNPVWLLIPCHRIVGSGGGLTGYAGGLEKKAALLAIERQA